MTEKIEALLEAKFKEPEFQDCYLVDIKHNRSRLEVFIDSDSGMTFEKCRTLSRYLESFLDEHQWLGEKYTLDVSSPGVGTPLKRLRQYKNNIGRSVEVTRKEGKPLTGQLLEADESKILIAPRIKKKGKGKKKTEPQPIEIPFENIKKTIVKVSW